MIVMELSLANADSISIWIPRGSKERTDTCCFFLSRTKSQCSSSETSKSLFTLQNVINCCSSARVKQRPTGLWGEHKTKAHVRGVMAACMASKSNSHRWTKMQISKAYLCRQKDLDILLVGKTHCVQFFTTMLHDWKKWIVHWRDHHYIITGTANACKAINKNYWTFTVSN